MDIAEMTARHVALTALQLNKLGCSKDTLSRLVKRGVLYRYKVTTPDGSLPSIFTAGNTAGKIARLPVPRFVDMESLRSVLIVNQVIVSILNQSEARVDINIKRPIQTVTINKPVGVMYARSLNYAGIPLRYNLNQAIIIIPDTGYVSPGFPFRYVLEDELDLLEIRYYYGGDSKLLPVDVDFTKKEAVLT
jgi:hypothetical protein